MRQIHWNFVLEMQYVNKWKQSTNAPNATRNHVLYYTDTTQKRRRRASLAPSAGSRRSTVKSPSRSGAAFGWVAAVEQRRCWVELSWAATQEQSCLSNCSSCSLLRCSLSTLRSGRAWHGSPHSETRQLPSRTERQPQGRVHYEVVRNFL